MEAEDLQLVERKAKGLVKRWRYTFRISGSAALLVGLALRFWRGYLGLSGTAWAASAAVAAGVWAGRRYKLTPLTADNLAFGIFKGQTAVLFSRLPEAAAALQKKLGGDELGLKSVNNVQALRRLLSLSYYGERRPYTEARQAAARQAAAAAELEEGARLLAFAEAAYEEPEVVYRTCEERGFHVLHLHETSKPGLPSYFLCFNEETKEAILSVRGTKTPADAVTDLVGDVEEEERKGGRKLMAHAGFFIAARSIIERVLPAIRHLLVPLQYRLTVTGHSLGASTAALTALLLTDEAEGWSADQNPRCVCFAPCPCLDSSTSLGACDEAGQRLGPLITSFICNDDIVPRMSLQNVSRLQLLSRGASIEQVLELAEKASPDPADLFVPGKTIVLHAEQTLEEEEGADCKRQEQGPKPAGEKPRSLRLPGEGEDDEEEKAIVAVSRPARAWSAWTGDGQSFPELRYVELAPGSITEHMAPVYREAIAAAAQAQGVVVEPSARAAEPFAEWLQRCSGELQLADPAEP